MRPDPQKIIDEAMLLEPTSRALVAEALLESLDFGDDFEISKHWREEIRRRCEEIDQNTIKLIPSEQVLAGLRRKYS